MKDFRGMKRQRSRSRKPTGNPSNPNRAYESNGPEGTKARGNAQTIYEKYQQLARDANSSGDRVLAENHLQHSEHYFRLIRQTQPQRPVSEYVQRDPFMNGFDIDFEEDIDADYADNNEVANPEAETDTTQTLNNGAFDERNEDENRSRNRDRDRDRDRNQNRDRDRDRNRDRNQNRDQNREPRDNRDNNEPREVSSFDSAEPDNSPRRDNNRESGRDTSRDSGRDSGRETRRERFDRNRNQPRPVQDEILNGGSFQPQSPLAASPLVAAPAFIASTQPLGSAPSRLDQPKVIETPRPVQKPISPKTSRPKPVDDQPHLPAFLKAAPSVEAVTTNAIPVIKKPRVKRIKVEDSVEATQDL